MFLNFTSIEKTEKRPSVSTLQKLLRENNVSKEERHSILKKIKEERSLSRKIGRLEMMKTWFKYWHVAHMPFALIMLVVVIIHVIVAFTFGYKWIF